MVSGFKNSRTKDLVFKLKKKVRKERSAKSFGRDFFLGEVILDGGGGGEGSTKAPVRCCWRRGVLTSKLIFNDNYS